MFTAEKFHKCGAGIGENMYYAICGNTKKIKTWFLHWRNSQSSMTCGGVEIEG